MAWPAPTPNWDTSEPARLLMEAGAYERGHESHIYKYVAVAVLSGCER